ncbi:Glutathione S-transferase domain [Burkholderia sp. H160]|nr:Glutathione S-transferase domain [Burkholderia sp. H160]
MNARLTLASHVLCPYVQRAVIVLKEKGVPFERRDVDLSNKPDWFLACSPLGKTPVLLVDGEPIFESAVICEYLDDTLSPRLHPEEAVTRARHRGWMEFGSSLLNTIGAFYNASDEATLAAQAAQIKAKLAQVEAVLGNGPWFAGNRFSLVDAVFGPVFRYFDVFDELEDFRFFEDLPKTVAWRVALAARPSVREAAHPDYAALLRAFLRRRDSALARRMRYHKM